MPAPFSWAALRVPAVMGILNVTPDSFSDGGKHWNPQVAIQAGLQMAAAGADMLDIGGESTRPGAVAVAPDEEQQRILPVIAGLSGAGIPISVDTRNASTMAAALDAGASVVNDVSALTFDGAATALVARRGCPVILMHMRGTPATMNSLAQYGDVAHAVLKELADRIHAVRSQGVQRDAIALDPGFGFAKTAEHSIELLRQMRTLRALGFPIVAGVSRKRFIGTLSGTADPRSRDAGSLAAGLFALSQGASVLRVHDVAGTVQAVRVWQALQT